MITQLSLTAFKCFETLRPVRLSRINLFLGCNGRGKSTFLQSLLLLAQSIDADKKMNHIEFNGRFIELGNYDDVQCAFNSQTPTISFCTDDNKEKEFQVKFTRYPGKDQWGKIISLRTNEKEIVEEVKGAKSVSTEKSEYVIGSTSTLETLAQLHNVFYVSADRRGPIDTMKKNDNIADNQIGIHGEYMLNDLFRKDTAFMQEVIRETSTILSGASIFVEQDGRDYVRMLIDSVDNKETGFRPSNVGFGYSYVLPVILTVLLAEKGSKLFIENPEAHLHPGAQSRLMDFICKYAVSKDLQVFIETHSDHLINGVRIAIKEGRLDKTEARVVFFERNDSKSPIDTQIMIDSEGNLSDYPDGFMSEWGDQMSKLI